ncbi:hypothetical protein M408DRAFT_226733 [Serendipita vermifera MAFF 305830]|uniref:Uncharacterized protein n=1 Tax=Serendipita vermifera MAFF 305830 TaxID=933852 RepID=A0A0C2VYP6_SERVB|nr:hypothetical protein M408DRAFT_226733 [Serendipita vermifera MAFF 305830]
MEGILAYDKKCAQEHLALYITSPMSDAKDTPKELYALPHASLAEEGGRLDEQHNILKTLLDGLSPCSDVVAKVMMDGEAHTKSVLDLGSGSGA